MIAVDTNILVYSHREDSNFYKKSDQVLTELMEGDRSWAIPWPCIHEFFGVVTHPKIYMRPSSFEDALIQVECWLESPHHEVKTLYSTDRDFSRMKGLQVRNPLL